MDALGRAFGPLGAIRGDLKSETVTTVYCENNFFKNAFCSFLEILMVLFSPSWRFLGRSGAQSGSPKYPKTCPNVVKKTVPKRTRFYQFLDHFWDNFGAKKERVWGTRFLRFFGVAPNGPREAIWSRFWCHLGLSGPNLGSILAHLGPICAHLAAIWTPSWATLDHLRAILIHLGYILCRITSWAHLTFAEL